MCRSGSARRSGSEGLLAYERMWAPLWSSPAGTGSASCKSHLLTALLPCSCCQLGCVCQLCCWHVLEASGLCLPAVLRVCACCQPGSICRLCCWTFGISWHSARFCFSKHASSASPKLLHLGGTYQGAPSIAVICTTRYVHHAKPFAANFFLLSSHQSLLKVPALSGAQGSGHSHCQAAGQCHGACCKGHRGKRPEQVGEGHLSFLPSKP